MVKRIEQLGPEDELMLLAMQIEGTLQGERPILSSIGNERIPAHISVLSKGGNDPVNVGCGYGNCSNTVDSSAIENRGATQTRNSMGAVAQRSGRASQLRRV